MRELIYVIASCLVALVISARTIPTVINVSRQLKLFAIPNGRSSTIYKVPTLGGIAIFLGFILGMTLTSDGFEIKGLPYITAAVMVMFFVGLKDDIVSLSAKKKLIAEIIVAGILIFLGQYRFTSLHGFMGIETIPYIPSVLLTAFVFIVFINAFNLIDGIDGLAAGLSIFAASVFGVWFFIAGHHEFAIVAFSLVGALTGFFFYNVYGTRNKIFMGDTGSLILGTIMAILVIQFNEFNLDRSAPYAIYASPAVSFSILIYPLMDTLRVFAIRIIQKKSPFTADKNHTHHRLLALGLNHHSATYLLLAVNALFTFVAFSLQSIGLGIIWLMAFNFVVGSILLLLPSYILGTKKSIPVDDPYQKIIIFGDGFFIGYKKNKPTTAPSQTQPFKTIKEKLQRISFW
jgi:UDP-N-acetylmuramyl pentapeptide phosphotransferase/UDP-N-acetylglucosamine-1-phosphate transferase